MLEGFAQQQARIIVGSNMCVPIELFANKTSKIRLNPELFLLCFHSLSLFLFAQSFGITSPHF